MRPTKSTSWFTRLTKWTAHAAGRPATFSLAASVIAVWALLGPYYRFSDTWQLVINTGTTIVTFLMVFLIQSTQSRDTRALHLKLDELIRVNKQARNSLLNLEDLSGDEIEKAKKAFDRMVRQDQQKGDQKSAAEVPG
jgi:low affinity Fe/Cu permease